MQVPVSHMKSCLGLSPAAREEKRNDNFYTGLSLPLELRGVSQYIRSTDCPTLYNLGPISTRSHLDGVGGWSALVEGWKVFCWWEPQHSHILHYDTAHHLFNLQAARDVVSFQWALLGPGASISLPVALVSPAQLHPRRPHTRPGVAVRLDLQRKAAGGKVATEPLVRPSAQGWEPASRLGVAKGDYEELAMSWLRDQKSQIVSVSCWTIARVECDSL